MDFARRMFEAIRGVKAPPDPPSASVEDRSILGAWASQWVQTFSKGLKPGQFEGFCERCSRDIRKKRGKAGIKDLGAVAMARIVPGILAAMAKERG